MKIIACLTLALGMIASAASGQAGLDHRFFPAIKRGDIAGAEAMIIGKVEIADWERSRLKQQSLTPAQFFGMVKSCYFRAAFAKNDDRDMEIGVWMCALTPTKTDPNRSKTVLIHVKYQGRKVSLDSYSERESMKIAPAPSR